MLIASGGREAIVLWDLATGKQVFKITGNANFIDGLAFSPDGRMLAATTRKLWGGIGTQVYRLQPDRGIRVFRGFATSTEKWAFSPQSKLLAALSDNWRVAVWDLQANSLLHVLPVPPGNYTDNATLVFDSQGQRLAFASSRSASVWNARTGRSLGDWKLPRGLLHLRY